MQQKNSITKKALVMLGLMFVGTMATKIGIKRHLQEIVGTVQQNIQVQEAVTTQIQKPEKITKTKRLGYETHMPTAIKTRVNNIKNSAKPVWKDQKQKKGSIKLGQMGNQVGGQFNIEASKSSKAVKGKKTTKGAKGIGKGLKADFVPKGQTIKELKMKSGIKTGSEKEAVTTP